MSTEAKKPALLWERMTAISTAVLAIIGALALYLAWRQIEEFRNAAQVQHIDDLVQRWNHEMVGVRRALALKRLDSKQQTLLPLDQQNPPAEMIDILDFYQHMDLMIERGYVDKDDVWSDFSEEMFPFYADVHAYVDQEQAKNPTLWFGVSDLMEDMRKDERDYNQGISDHPDMTAVVGFYRSEATLQPGVQAPHKRAKDERRVKKTSK